MEKASKWEEAPFESLGLGDKIKAVWETKHRKIIVKGEVARVTSGMWLILDDPDKTSVHPNNVQTSQNETLTVYRKAVVPFEWPKGIGAVVKSGDGSSWVRVAKSGGDVFVDAKTGHAYMEWELELLHGDFELISEGVE